MCAELPKAKQPWYQHSLWQIVLFLGVVAVCGCGPSRAQQDLHVNNLRMVAIAMREHHDKHDRFPSAASRDEDGKPLLSWRVALLPYLEQKALHDRFHHDEPWDSLHNLTLLDQMPDVYRVPWEENDGRTRLMVFVEEGTPFGGQDGISLGKIRDGMSNTIMFVEAGADKALPWTKPEDLPFNPDDPIAEMGDILTGKFLVVFFDGSIQKIERDSDAETLRRLIRHNDGLVIDGSGW
jgi:hypothetical protein